MPCTKSVMRLLAISKKSASTSDTTRASRAVPERIRDLGGNPVKNRVGHGFIKAKMRETDTVFAGELSGHYYYRELGFIESGIASIISMLNLLAMQEKSLSQFVCPLQKYAQSGEINIHVHDTDQLFNELETTCQDGEQHWMDCRSNIQVDGLTCGNRIRSQWYVW